MKACFLLQRRFAYIGHYIALILKEKYGLLDICAYVQLRSSYTFLKNQANLSYSSLLLDEDVHKTYLTEELDLNYLRTFEKEYGLPNLWPYLAVDRIVMHNQLIREYPYDSPPYTHEEILKIAQVNIKRIIEFLEKEKPDFIFFSVVGSIGAKLLYHIAKKKSIQTICAITNTLPRTTVLSTEYERLSWVEELTEQYQNDPTVKRSNYYEQATSFMRDYRAKPVIYSDTYFSGIYSEMYNYIKPLDWLSPQNLWRSLLWFVHILKEYTTSSYRYDYSFIRPWGYIKDRIQRKIRNLRGNHDLYDCYAPERDNFVFFPLQYEPEVSLMLLAPFFTDQINVIKQIARSLPVGYILYVKEHPQMTVYRPRAYYKKLKKIPNVKLINPSISGFDIMKNARLITTITGTVGWEASLLKKPVITFGDIFYNQLSFVKNCRTIEHLPFIVKEQLKNFQYNEEEMTSFVAALLQDSAPVDMLQLWEKETDENKKKMGLEPLADLLAKKIKLKKLNH